MVIGCELQLPQPSDFCTRLVPDNMALISRWKHVANGRVRAATDDLLVLPTRRRRRRRRQPRAFIVPRSTTCDSRAAEPAHLPLHYYSLPLSVPHKIYRE